MRIQKKKGGSERNGSEGDTLPSKREDGIDRKNRRRSQQNPDKKHRKRRVTILKKGAIQLKARKKGGEVGKLPKKENKVR